MTHFNLKSLWLAVALLCLAGTASAQRLTTNTVDPKDLAPYDGQTIDLTLYRYIFKGWNTVCFPFTMTEQELNAAFGEDCRLETLVGVENNGQATKLNFKDVKPDGLQANTPYILYSDRQSGVRTIHLPEAQITIGDVVKTFSDNTGTEVSFSGVTQKQGTQGVYGIIAKDNANAAFVDASQVDRVYASRCYIKVNNGETTRLLTSNHIDYNVTGIQDIQASATATDEPVDVYNISGIRIAKNLPLSRINSLGKGVYVVKGRTIWVR